MPLKNCRLKGDSIILSLFPELCQVYTEKFYLPDGNHKKHSAYLISEFIQKNMALLIRKILT